MQQNKVYLLTAFGDLTTPPVPASCRRLQPFVQQDLDKIYFSNFRRLDIKGVPCWLTRTG